MFTFPPHLVQIPSRPAQDGKQHGLEYDEVVRAAAPSPTFDLECHEAAEADTSAAVLPKISINSFQRLDLISPPSTPDRAAAAADRWVNSQSERKFMPPRSARKKAFSRTVSDSGLRVEMIAPAPPMFSLTEEIKHTDSAGFSDSDDDYHDAADGDSELDSSFDEIEWRVSPAEVAPAEVVGDDSADDDGYNFLAMVEPDEYGSVSFVRYSAERSVRDTALAGRRGAVLG